MTDIEPILRPEQCRLAELTEHQGYVVKCPHDGFTRVEFVEEGKRGNYGDMQAARNTVVRAAAEHQNAHVLAYVHVALERARLYGTSVKDDQFGAWFIDRLAQAGLRITVVPLSEADRQKAEDEKQDAR